MGDIQQLLREAAHDRRIRGTNATDYDFADRLEAAAEKMGEPVAYEHVAECQYGDTFPCNPACYDSGSCYKRRIDSSAPLLAPPPAVPDEYELANIAIKSGLVGVTYDRWRDGIDLPVATMELRAFAKHLLAAAKEQGHE